MAHNLAVIGGKEAMAYQGATPWHELGTRLASLTNVGDAMREARIDYTVREEPLFLQDGRQVALRKAILRNEADGPGVVLGTVGADYGILQHVDGFTDLDVLCTEHGMTIESAGALGKGERVWMLFKMPETVQPVPGDDVRGYLLATTGHDGRWSYSIRPTPIRVVCQNTLDAASLTKGSEFVRLFHTKGGTDRLKTAATIVTRIVESFKETGETFAAFAGRKMSEAEVIRFVETLFPGEE